MCSVPRQHGLTLIELLVVLVLIGIITSVAVLAINVHDPDAALRQEAQRLASLLGMARQEAMLSARPLALRIEPTGYAFVQWQAGHWAALDHDRVFRARQLPEGMTMETGVNRTRVAPRGSTDHSSTGTACHRGVLFLPSGEVTPCVIALRTEAATSDPLHSGQARSGQRLEWRVRINGLGAISTVSDAGTRPRALLAPGRDTRGFRRRTRAG